jgi:hypothetical protein
MKAIASENPGYRVSSIATMMGQQFYKPPSVMDHLPCAGVLLSCGDMTTDVCRDLLAHLRLGAISIDASEVSRDSWAKLFDTITDPSCSVVNIAMVLLNIDEAPSWLPQYVITLCDENRRCACIIATATSVVNVNAELTRRLVLYLGLNKNGCMQYGLPDGRLLMIDTGSLRRASDLKNTGHSGPEFESKEIHGQE